MFLINSCLGLFTAADHKSAPLLPKLRGHFAEFLNERAKEVYLLLVAALVAGLTKQLAVLLLGHTLAALLDNGTHRISSLYSYPAEPFDSVATRGYLYRYNRSKTHFRHRNTLAF